MSEYTIIENGDQKEIVFPENVKEIAEGEFCGWKDLTKVVLTGIERIGDRAFQSCPNLEEIVFEPGLHYIGHLAFDSCRKLRSIALPEGLKHVGVGAFRGCKLQTVVVPKTVTDVRAQAFSGCKNIVIYDSIAPLTEDREKSINSAVHLGLIGVGRTGFDTFECNDDYKWWAGREYSWINHVITVKSTETEAIKYQVFMECEPEQRQYVRILLWNWKNYAEFNFSELDAFFPKIKGTNYKIKVALSRLMYKYELPEEKELAYKKYLTRVPKDVAKLCVDEDSVEWLEMCDRLGVLKPEHIRDCIEYATAEGNTEIVAWMIDYTGRHPVVEKKKKDEFELDDISRPRKPRAPKIVDKTSDAYMKIVWGVTTDFRGRNLITSYKGEDTEIVFPTEVAGKKISGIASRRSAPTIYPLLKSVVIPEGYEEIGGSAFADCKSLTEVKLPESLTSIGDNAFSECSSLETITLPRNVAEIGKWMFRDCHLLKDVYIYNPYVSGEGKAVFRGCNNYVVHAHEGARIAHSAKGERFVPFSGDELKKQAEAFCKEPVKEMVLLEISPDDEMIKKMRSKAVGDQEMLAKYVEENAGFKMPMIGDKVLFDLDGVVNSNGELIGVTTVNAQEISRIGAYLEGKVISGAYNYGTNICIDIEVRLKS